MLFLFLSAFLNVVIGLGLKLFPRYKVQEFPTIVVSYLICFGCGWLHLWRPPLVWEDTDSAWAKFALALGVNFVSGFTVTALTVRYFGVTTSQIMQKMTILASVPFAILVYDESAGWAKLTGVVLALGAIILINLKGKEKKGQGAKGKKLAWLLVLPLLTWLLSSLGEMSLLKVRKDELIQPGDPAFITVIFGSAGLVGSIAVLVMWLTKRLQPTRRDVLAGIVLGVFNYWATIFLWKALASQLEGSALFPLMSITIIVLTTIGAVTLFREKLARINWAGLALAVVALALLTLT